MRKENFYNLRGKRETQNKKLLVFWVCSLFFLAGWFVFLQIETKGYPTFISQLKPLVGLLPLKEYQKEELRTILTIIPDVVSEKERTFLIVFQDPDELRPGGGLVEAFGVLKIENEKIIAFEIHDVEKFDAEKNNKMSPPYPIESVLKIKDWKFQNSNWSADFPTNAKNLQKFYELQGGREVFDGVVGISFQALSEMLEVTGPLVVEGYDGEYNSENFSSKIQYYKEKKEIDYALRSLLVELVKHIQNSNWNQKKLVLQKIERLLIQKDILLYSNNQQVQKNIRYLGWGGGVNQENIDYLMAVDANLGSLKTDKLTSRNFEYTVDFTSTPPKAKFDFNYENKGRVRDWQTADYVSYFRLYIPQNSWLIESEGTGNLKFGEEKGRKYFGSLVQVPLDGKAKISFSYYLPSSITADDYELFIQKQPGVKDLKGKINIIKDSNDRMSYQVTSERSRRIKP